MTLLLRYCSDWERARASSSKANFGEAVRHGRIGAVNIAGQQHRAIVDGRGFHMHFLQQRLINRVKGTGFLNYSGNGGKLVCVSFTTNGYCDADTIL